MWEIKAHRYTQIAGKFVPRCVETFARGILFGVKIIIGMSVQITNSDVRNTQSTPGFNFKKI